MLSLTTRVGGEFGVRGGFVRGVYWPFDEPKEFFWGSADGGDLQSIVDEYATALAPNATF